MQFIQNEFNKQARSYDDYSVLQEKVALDLLGGIEFCAQIVVDLGAGTGMIRRNIHWDFKEFIGVDFAQKLLEKHPQDTKTKTICADFNKQGFMENVPKADLVVSSSALQWALDLDGVFAQIAQKTSHIAFAIFTSACMLDLYRFTKLENPFKSASEIVAICKKHFVCEVELKTYSLAFDDTQELFSYIKKSGVSGGENRLGYTKTRELIRHYPHKNLDFEVVFLHS